VGNPLEWSSARRATALFGVTSLYHLQYYLWNHWMLTHPPRQEMVNATFLEGSMPSYLTLLLLSVAGTVAIPAFSRLVGDSVVYEHLATQYYACSLVYYGYAIGILNISTGVVLAAAPVVGFIFFDRAAVFWSMVSAVALVGVVTYLTTTGTLVYAPALRGYLHPDGSLDPFWVANLTAFIVPHFVVLVVIAYYVLGRWREREAEVLRMSMTDPLTGLLNRRSALLQLEREHERSHREGHPYAVVLVDLDHFKRVNDSHGHHVGDAVLIEAARVMQATVRRTDVVGRMGGEEFLLVLSGAELEAATHIAERCRQALSEVRIDVGRSEPLRISASLGLSSNQGVPEIDAEGLVRRADDALYRSKAEGRDRLTVATA